MEETTFIRIIKKQTPLEISMLCEFCSFAFQFEIIVLGFASSMLTVTFQQDQYIFLHDTFCNIQTKTKIVAAQYIPALSQSIVLMFLT